MSEQPEPAEKGARPIIRNLLVVSLALNLLIAGLVGGVVIKKGWHDSRHGHPSHMFGGPMTRALGEEDRQALRQEMRRAYQEDGRGGAERRAEFAALIEDLRTDPFDPEAVAERMARQRSRLAGHLELAQGVLLDRLARMDSAERAAFADRVEAELDRRRARK